MISLNKQPGSKILELGGGANPHPETDVRVDVRHCTDANGKPTVDFTADLSQPLPIQSNEWDGVYCAYCLEHLPFPAVPGFLSEVFRVLKPGGRAVFVVPNTAAQLQWIQDHPEGWDGKDSFTSASEILYGSQDYAENTHKIYLDPDIARELFSAAGFVGVQTHVYNERATDLVVIADKSNTPVVPVHGVTVFASGAGPDAWSQTGNVVRLTPVAEEPLAASVAVIEGVGVDTAVVGSMGDEIIVTDDKQAHLPTTVSRESLFDKEYFNGGGKVGGYAREGYRDFPAHEITARHVLSRKPSSVLELGAARGYILKRIQDTGIPAVGLEISKHCHMTRVCEGVYQADLCKTPWRLPESMAFHASMGLIPSYDFCYSVATMEHIPEQFIPAVIREMARTCKRGLHGIDFGESDDGFDQTHCTLKDREWWLKQFRMHAPGWPVEIVDKEELERGQFPAEVMAGDGKLKLNLGSFTTMFHYGWINLDVHNLGEWSQQNGYRYMQHDVRAGLPFGTGDVDLIFCVKPGGMVRTFNGMRAIENIRTGDMVLTHKGRWRKVLRTFKRDVSDEKMTEFYGSCVPFSLTGNHEVFVQRHRRIDSGRKRGLVYENGREWIPSALVSTNDRTLIPIPPVEEAMDRVDFADFVDEAGSEIVHSVVKARKNGDTYERIMSKFGVTKMQVRRWTKQGSIPRGVAFVGDDFIRMGNAHLRVPRFANVNDSFGRLLGYMLSDGHANAQQFATYFGANQQEYADDFIRVTEEVFGIRPTERGGRKNIVYTRYCHSTTSRILRKMMGSVKGKPGRKRIPRTLFRSGNQDFYKGLLLGMWRGDGSVTATGACYTSVDRRLIYQVQEILARLNISSRIRRKDQTTTVLKNGCTINGGVIYTLHVSGGSLRNLCEILLVPVPAITRGSKDRSFVSAEGIEGAVKVREYRYTGPVYNIQVEEDETYTVNGVAVHNCGHMLEHLSYRDGLAFLRECRRVLKPDGGAMRIVVPDAGLLTRGYGGVWPDGTGGDVHAPVDLSDYDEINDGSAAAPTTMAKLWALVHEGHAAAYDWETLSHALREAGFTPTRATLGRGVEQTKQLRKETVEMGFDLSLFVDAVPLVG